VICRRWQWKQRETSCSFTDVRITGSRRPMAMGGSVGWHRQHVHVIVLAAHDDSNNECHQNSSAQHQIFKEHRLLTTLRLKYKHATGKERAHKTIPSKLQLWLTYVPSIHCPRAKYHLQNPPPLAPLYKPLKHTLLDPCIPSFLFPFLIILLHRPTSLPSGNPENPSPLKTTPQLLIVTDKSQSLPP